MQSFTKIIFSIILCCTIASCSWMDDVLTSDDSAKSTEVDPTIAEANAAIEKARKDEAKAVAQKTKAEQDAKEKAAVEKAQAQRTKAQQQAEATAKAERQTAEEKAEAEKVKAEQQAKAIAAAKKAKAEQQAATLKAEQQAKAKKSQTAQQVAAIKAEEDASAASLKAEQDAKNKAAAEKAKAEQQALALKAEQEAKINAEKQAALEAEQQAKAKAAAKKAQAEQQAAALKAEQEAKTAAAKQAALKSEQEAKAAATKQAALKAEQQAKDQAAAEKAQAAQQAASKAAVITPSNISKTNARAKLDSPMYNPVGGIKAGNSNGTIPKWTGSMLGAPKGVSYRSGQPHPDPYSSEKPLFTIHAGNFQKYAANLSEGQLALFKKYPDTFAMPIYKSHRDGRFNEQVEKRTHWNAAKTDLVNGVDGLNNYTGGIPFPFPENGAEALWNARVVHPHPTLVGTVDDIAVYLNGNTQRRRQYYVSEFPFSYKSNLIGQVDEQIGINAGLVHVTTEEPRRQKGQMVIIHEALDQVKYERKAWIYMPGARRVRRAPTVGFDTPDGPGGLITVDDALGFNGAMGRYNWKLIGKKETYIPYNSYKFDSPKASYNNLLTKGHANPNYMRYELHRTWVVEATLKADARHVYTKRRFYIDEDSWHFSLVESYDGRGNLWRVGILNTIYDYSVKGFIARAQMFHDLQSGAYIAMRLINETSTPDYTAKPQGDEYYTPSNLRKIGR